MKKMRQFWPNCKAIALLFWQKLPILKFCHFDLRLRSEEMRYFWPKSKAIALVFWQTMTKIETR